MILKLHSEITGKSGEIGALYSFLARIVAFALQLDAWP